MIDRCDPIFPKSISRSGQGLIPGFWEQGFTKPLKKLERATDFQPSTPTLARFGSNKILVVFRILKGLLKIRIRSEHSQITSIAPWRTFSECFGQILFQCGILA